MSEEESEKPKKAFQLKVIVWDDGEVDCDIREYRKLGTGRGAPALCGPLSPNDFKKSLDQYGLDSDGVCGSIAIEVGIDDEEADQPSVKATHVPETRSEVENDEIDDPDLDDLPDFDGIEED